MKADAGAEREGREERREAIIKGEEVSEAIDTAGINLNQHLSSNICYIQNGQPNGVLIIQTFLTWHKQSLWLGSTTIGGSREPQVYCLTW